MEESWKCSVNFVGTADAFILAAVEIAQSGILRWGSCDLGTESDSPAAAATRTAASASGTAVAVGGRASGPRAATQAAFFAALAEP